MEWTDSTEEALSFPSSVDALNFYMAHFTKSTQLVLHFDGSNLDVVIPLEDCEIP